MNKAFIFIGDNDYSLLESSNSPLYSHHLIPHYISLKYKCVFIGGSRMNRRHLKYGYLSIYHPLGLKSIERFRIFKWFKTYQIKSYLKSLVKNSSLKKIYLISYCFYLDKPFKIIDKEIYFVQFDDEFLDPFHRSSKFYNAYLCVNYSYYKILSNYIRKNNLLHCPIVSTINDTKVISRNYKDNFDKIEFCIIGNIDFSKLDIIILESIANIYKSSVLNIHGVLNNGTDKFLLHNLINKYPNIIYHGEYDNRDIIKLISKYDIGLVPFILNSRTMGAWPTKIIEYLYANLMVIVPDLGFEKPIRKFLYFYRNFRDIKIIIDNYDKKEFIKRIDSLENSLKLYSTKERSKVLVDFSNNF